MKNNTRTAFVMSFFGCFLLPVIIILSATLSVFFKIDSVVAFFGWISEGGIFILAIYEIIIILITIMLGLTLRLKNVEYITADKVVRRRKNDVVVEKIKVVDIKNADMSKRKEVKVPEQRVVEKTEFPEIEVRTVRKREPKTSSAPVQQTTAPEVNKPNKPKQVFSAIKK